MRFKSNRNTFEIRVSTTCNQKPHAPSTAQSLEAGAPGGQAEDTEASPRDKGFGAHHSETATPAPINSAKCINPQEKNTKVNTTHS